MSGAVAAAIDPIVARLAALDTPVVSDALDHLGLPGATAGLQPLWPSRRVVAGRVRTVQAGPASGDGPRDHIAASAVRDAAVGEVVVVANFGRTDVSCWGGILAAGAVAAGVAAVIVDGACRDVDDCEGLDLPLFARAAVPISARTRIVQVAADVPVTVAGVEVHPGDIAVADRCGAVFVASAHAPAVVELAEALAGRERDMVAAVRSGASIVDVMHDRQFAVTVGEGRGDV